MVSLLRSETIVGQLVISNELIAIIVIREDHRNYFFIKILRFYQVLDQTRVR